MTAGHEHHTQPRSIGFPGHPGFPALPAAARICYAIADGCASCAELALDEAAADSQVCAALIAYTADLIADHHRRSMPPSPTGTERSLPSELGQTPTRVGAPVPGPDFTEAARAAFAACPASCAGNGVPAAAATIRSWNQQRRMRAAADAIALLGIYQLRTDRGRQLLLTPTPA